MKFYFVKTLICTAMPSSRFCLPVLLLLLGYIRRMTLLAYLLGDKTISRSCKFGLFINFLNGGSMPHSKQNDSSQMNELLQQMCQDGKTP